MGWDVTKFVFGVVWGRGWSREDRRWVRSGFIASGYYNKSPQIGWLTTQLCYLLSRRSEALNQTHCAKANSPSPSGSIWRFEWKICFLRLSGSQWPLTFPEVWPLPPPSKVAPHPVLLSPQPSWLSPHPSLMRNLVTMLGSPA